MGVSRSGFYEWLGRPKRLADVDQFAMCVRMKALFEASRNSLGSREMTKYLRKEGFVVGRYRVRSLMKKLGLVVTQRVAFRVTTKGKANHLVAPNLVNQNFCPVEPNHLCKDC